MNQYSQLLYYLKELAENDPYINTVTKDSDSNIDLDKGNLFPLFNIDILNGAFPSNSTISFDVQLTCLAIRDINKEIRTDKFFKQDNEIDNHNETLAVLNRMWLIMKRNFDEKNITASDNPTFNKIDFSGKNLLDGWQLDFTIEMPNVDINLCQDLQC